MNEANVIDLLSDDEHDDGPIVADSKREATSFRPSAVKRLKTETNNGHLVYCLDDSDEEENEESADSTTISSVAFAAGVPAAAPTDISTDDDLDIEEIAATAPGPFKTTGLSESDEQKKDDQDLVIVGSIGTNALVDFPHSRENCVTHPHANDPLRCCPNCFCYVCDIPANECKAWSSHCDAKHSDRHWRTLREQHRRNDTSTSTAAPSTNRQVTTHHPRATVPVPRPARSNLSNGNTISVRDVLDAVTRVHPVEMSVTSPKFVTTLRHYQKQSLAFMVEVEGRKRSHEKEILGGFLCDEVGMGKSAVVLALIATNPAPEALVASSASQAGKMKENQRTKVKTTVILTSVSLLGQWEDECRKHAPGLRYAVFHPSSNRRVSPPTVYSLDIIISTTTFKWPEAMRDEFEFHRVVFDESHLFATGTTSACDSKAGRFRAARKWCVTATPCTTSLSNLYRQMGLFQHYDDSCSPGSEGDTMDLLRATILQFHYTPNNAAFLKLVDDLKKVMIRHTKAQRINGSEALALPASTTTTLTMDMSSTERQFFGQMHVSRRNLVSLLKRGGNRFTMERVFLFRMKHAFSERPDLQLTKVKKLLDELQELKRTEPNFRAVVFTQYKIVYKACVNALDALDMDVFKFDGSTSAKQRDQAIRRFQNQASNRPAVFVITLRAGNVGITLTAASRVYLLEPVIDPAAEHQAAGRIHRLGQTKPVEVKRFVFNNSVESNILNLHGEVQEGRLSITNGIIPPEGVAILSRGLRTSG